MSDIQKTTMSDILKTNEHETQGDAAIDLLEHLLMEAEKKLSKEAADKSSGEANSVSFAEGAFITFKDRQGRSGRKAYNDFIADAPQRHHIWPVFITALAVFILLTGGLTYFNRTVLASQAEERAEIKRQGDELLDESLAFIQEADKVVIALDVASESRLNEEIVPRLEALLDQADSTQALLDNAIEKAWQAKATYTNKADKALAQYAVDAAVYRKQMLTLSSQLAEYDIKAIESILRLEQAWNLIIRADQDMRTAVEMVATYGAKGVVESRNYNDQALYRLLVAEETLMSISEVFPEIDLTCLTDYLTAKIESARLALDSDNYYLDGYYTRAKEKDEEFKVKDQEVVELALRIPSDPTMTLVIAAYDKVTRETREEYKKNRSEAADADAHLRAYLGINKN